MNSTLAIPVSMKAYKDLLANVTPDITVCVRGRHAVGKSEGVYQAAKMIKHDFYQSQEWLDAQNSEHFPFELKNHKYEDGLPVIERRLSQMTEGDIIGLPRIHKHPNGEESTQFKPCDWLIYACRFPVVLFLDERNRALEGVKQAVFQLSDSKAYYGYKLHPQTRIVIAENVGDSYQVQECDPAEISRTATVTLEPSVDEFKSYIKEFCHELTLDFIETEGQSVVENTGIFEPNKKYPDRRAWVRLDKMFREQNLFDKCQEHTFYVLSCSMLGTEVGQAFTNFCRNNNTRVSSNDIFTDWLATKKRVAGRRADLTNDKYIECSEKLSEHIKLSSEEDKSKEHLPKLTKEQLDQLCLFVKDCPPEIRLKIWGSLSTNKEYVKYCHPQIVQTILAAVNGDNDNKSTASTEEADKTKTKKRGARQ